MTEVEMVKRWFPRFFPTPFAREQAFACVKFTQTAFGTCRLLLWDCDGRSYSYYVEVSTNQQHWTVVADKTKEACRSWQILTFEKRPITFIKIVGTHNTANEVRWKS